MIKIYIILVSLVLSIFIVFGFLGPMLISAKSNIAFWLGILICIIWPIIAAKLGINIYRRGRKLYEKTATCNLSNDAAGGVHAESPGRKCGDPGKTVR